MIRLLGVINSDKVNKQNVKFTVSSLESAYRDTWNTGVPSFLNHDHEKPIAWSTIGAHFELAWLELQILLMYLKN